MRQLALISIAAATLSFSAFASTQEMDQLYTVFQKTRADFLGQKNISKIGQEYFTPVEYANALIKLSKIEIDNKKYSMDL